MSHSLTKIWLHTVFGTKEREPLIRTEFEESLHDHIKNHLEKDFGCCLQAMNGTADHLHILFLLDQNYAVKDILRNVKGESSHWVNQKDFMKTKFAWQTGYGAFSVSESNLSDVEIYINNQKEHHRKKSFTEEYQEFIDKYNLRETVKTVSSTED